MKELRAGRVWLPRSAPARRRRRFTGRTTRRGSPWLPVSYGCLPPPLLRAGESALAASPCPSRPIALFEPFAARRVCASVGGIEEPPTGRARPKKRQRGGAKCLILRSGFHLVVSHTKRSARFVS